MTQENSYCIYCTRSSNEVPLIPFQYRGGSYWICPQHLPILIHKPAQLASKLPGLETLDGTEGLEHH
jgi:hypothetical protein